MPGSVATFRLRIFFIEIPAGLHQERLKFNPVKNAAWQTIRTGYNRVCVSLN